MQMAVNDFIQERTFLIRFNKMLSYLRETALQGALVLTKCGRL